MDEKQCTKCGETKPLDEFHRERRNADGRAAQCKPCACARVRRWANENRKKKRANDRRYADQHRGSRADYYRRYYEANKIKWHERYVERADEMRAAAAERRRASPHVTWRHSYIRRARSVGLEFAVEDFTKADVIARYGDACAYCEAGEFEHLDHFIPIKDGGPHTLENVRPSCAACNLAKSDLDPDEWLSEQAELDDLTEDELDDLIDAEIERWTQPKESK